MMELVGLGEAEFLRHEQEVSWPGIGAVAETQGHHRKKDWPGQ